MAAFSRGALLRPRIFQGSPSIPQCCRRVSAPSLRQFSQSSTPLLAAKKVKHARAKPSLAIDVPSIPSTPPPPAYRSFAQTLALRPAPTLLYRAPSHTLYILGSYSFGLFCLTYAGYNFYTVYLHPPPGISAWVPLAFGGVCFGMACLGTWLLLGPSRLIRSLTAIPTSAISHGSATNVPLSIRIEVRRALPLPGLPPRVFTAAPADLALSRRIHEPPAQAEVLHPAEARKRAEQQREFERSRILSVPFRHLSYAIWSGLQGLSRVWTREGFAKVRINGRSGVWKVDRAGGWALDGGRAVDRLVKTAAW